MKAVSQKINLMSTLTSLSNISDKIMENTSIENKEIKKMIDSNSKRQLFHK
jgi:hypothetical protein